MHKKIKIVDHILIPLVIFAILFFLFLNNKVIAETYLNLVIDPVQTFKELFFGWNNTLMLGLNYTQNYTLIFPFAFFYFVLFKTFNIYITQALIFAGILFGGFYGFVLFAKREFSTNDRSIYLGAFLFAFNLYTITSFHGASILLLPYVVMPYQLYFFNKIFTSKNFVPYSIGFAFSVLFMTGINPPLVAINSIVIIIYLVNLVITYQLHHKKILLITRLSITILFSILLNLYWIVGIALFYTHITADKIANILSEPLSMQNSASSYLNVFRTFGLWSFGQGWQDKPYFNYSPVYITNPIWIITMFLIPLIIFFSVFNKNNKKNILWILFLIIFAVPMVVGTNQGLFAGPYEWSYHHLPLFSMFRSGYKFIQVYILGLSLLLVYFLINIKIKRQKIMLAGIFLLLLSLNAFPLFSRRIFENIEKISLVPQYYYDAKYFFDTDKTEHRILLLPVQYSVIFTWGFTSGNPEFLWNKGLVARQGGSDDEISNALSLRLYHFLFTGQYDQANMLMHQLNVKYIVQRNDFDWKFYKNISQPPDVIKKALQPYKKIETFGKLDVYEVPKQFVNSLFVGSHISFKKISPVEFKIYVRNIKNPKNLSFLEFFDKDWKLFLEKKPSDAWCHPLATYENRLPSEENNKAIVTECKKSKSPLRLEDVSYAWKKPIFTSSHAMVQEYANGWQIDPSVIKKNYSSDYYSVNQDGSINAVLTLYFQTQSYFYNGLIISGITLVLFISYGLFIVIKRGIFYGEKK